MHSYLIKLRLDDPNFLQLTAIFQTSWASNYCTQLYYD